MSFLFGSRKTPAEMLRKHQRSLTKAIRDLDRERQKLEQQEKKVIAEIKKAARAGQNNACKVMAKDLVRTRRYVQKFYQMRTQLQGVSLRIQTMQSNQAMSDAMRGVTKAMKQMNKRINLPAIQNIMMDFEKESEIMDMKEEMMNDTIDDAMEEEEDEEESEQIVQQVLDEIGISFEQSLPSTATGPLKQTATKEAEQPVATPALDDGGDDAILQERLNNLRKD